MKQYIILSIGFVLIVLLSGCVSNSYVNELYGFSIEPPAEWETVEGEGIAIVAFYAPADSEGFTNNMNILADDLAKGYTLEEYNEASKKALPQLFPTMQFTLVDEGNLMINGLPARYLSYSFTLEGYSLLSKQIILQREDGTAFVISYVGTMDTFFNDLAEFDESIYTFKFT